MSEAEFQSECYDGVDSFIPYSREDKEEYIREKELNFPQCYKGRYVIVQTPRRRGLISILYLVDRSLTKRFWWSHDASYALVFKSKDAALAKALKYKYNGVRVMEI